MLLWIKHNLNSYSYISTNLQSIFQCYTCHVMFIKMNTAHPKNINKFWEFQTYCQDTLESYVLDNMTFYGEYIESKFAVSGRQWTGEKHFESSSAFSVVASRYKPVGTSVRRLGECSTLAAEGVRDLRWVLRGEGVWVHSPASVKHSAAQQGMRLPLGKQLQAQGTALEEQLPAPAMQQETPKTSNQGRDGAWTKVNRKSTTVCVSEEWGAACSLQGEKRERERQQEWERENELALAWKETEKSFWKKRKCTRLSFKSSKIM